MSAQPVRAGGRGISLPELMRLGDASARLARCALADLPITLAIALRTVVTGAKVGLVRVRDANITPVPGSGFPTGQLPGNLQRAATRAVDTGRSVIDQHLVRLAGNPTSVPAFLTPVGPTATGVLVAVLWFEIPGVIDQTTTELIQQLVQAAAARLDTITEAGPNNLFAALADTLDEGVLITSAPDARVVYANPYVGWLMDRRPQDLVGLPMASEHWTWQDGDGERLEVTPAQYSHDSGLAVRSQLVQVLPSGLDPRSEEGRAATRSLLASATPLVPGGDDGANLVLTRLRDITPSRRLAESRQDEVERLATMELISGLAWWTYQPGTRTVVWSREMYRIAGLDPNGPRVSQDEFLALIHPDDRWIFLDPEAGAVPQLSSIGYRLLRADGQVHYLQGWFRRYTTAQGEQRIVGISIDDTDRERALLALAERRYQFERSFDGTPYGTLLVSLAQPDRGVVIRANRAFCELIYPPQPGELVGAALSIVTPEGTASLKVEDLLDLAHRGERVVEQLIRPDGGLVWALITAIAIEDVEADDPFLIVHVLDITSQRLQEQALVVLARTDTLTGLANRAVVNERLDELSNDSREVAVLMLDLDRFKAINDGHGHHVGDELIVAIARRLESLVPSDATVARLGGDEFVVVLAGRSREELDVLAARIVGSLGEPITLPSGRRVVTGVSLGVAARQWASRNELLRDADLAMYQAKEDGGSQFAWCDEELRRRSASALDMEERLRHAIEDRRLVVYKQPIIRLANFGLAGHEALVRLRDPEIGVINPSDFIPLAEQTGLVADLDHWMLDQVLALVAGDRRYRDDPTMRASVNYSAHSLQRDDLVERIRHSVEQHGVPMNRLVIEITESNLLAERGSWSEAMGRLREEGLQVAIDDFGTGYSGLTYLHTIRPDRLKIDRAFVSGLDAPQTRAVSTISAIVHMAHAHGISVVAEGVETDTQAEYLRRLGCDFAQGYLYGEPQPWTLPRDESPS